MKFLSDLLLVAQVVSQCAVHKEWRELTPDEMKGYLKATQCLRKTASKLDDTDTRTSTHWEDLVAVHDFAQTEAHFITSSPEIKMRTLP